jgi:hypothetical protein
MWMNRTLSIGKAENGFVVEVEVPIKPEKKKESDDMVSAYPGSKDKVYLAKDHAEVLEIITKLLPMLDTEYASESEFDKAFNKAAAKK